MATKPVAPSPAGGYERRDASPRGLFLFFVLIACAVVLIVLILSAFLGYLSRSARPVPFVGPPFGNTRHIPTETPLLQPVPGLDMQEYMQSQKHILDSYGWIDRKSGVARVPIDQAMQLILKEGLPVRPAQNRPAPERSAGGNSTSPPNPGPGVKR